MGNKGTSRGRSVRKTPTAPGTHPAPQRHTDAALTDDEYAAFFLGVEVEVRSEPMKAAWWDEEQGRLFVSYKDGSLYSTAADDAFAEAFARAASKNGFWWDYCIRPGREVLKVL